MIIYCVIFGSKQDKWCPSTEKDFPYLPFSLDLFCAFVILWDDCGMFLSINKRMDFKMDAPLWDSKNKLYFGATLPLVMERLRCWRTLLCKYKNKITMMTVQLKICKFHL